MRQPRILLVLVSLAACGAVATLGIILGPAAPRAHAAATDLFISEYVEGSSTNKAIELFNGTDAAIVLDGTYAIQIFANGSATATATIPLVGTVAPSTTFVLARAGSAPELVGHAHQLTGNFLFNGNDAIALRRDASAIDVIGQLGTDPGTAWTGSGVTTLDGTMRRLAEVITGDADGSDPFDPAREWLGLPSDTFDGLGLHQTSGGPENRPPAAVGDMAEAIDTPIRIEVIANDTDPDGDPLTILAVEAPASGAAEIAADSQALIYTPPASPWAQEVFVYTVGDPSGETSTAAVVVVFVGEPGNDDPCASPPSIQGTAGSDLLFGTSGADVIHAGSGNDVVFGLGGDDVICGGPGRDVLFGNAGADTISDPSGRTWAFGGRGDDLITTGEGRDRLFGGPGADTLDGGEGRDAVDGGRGLDRCAPDPADRVRRCDRS